MEMDPAFAPLDAWTAERLHGLITRSVTRCALIVLDPEGRIVYWNEGASGIFGYDRGETLGQNGALLFLPEGKDRFRRELKTAAETGSADDENWLRRKDGSRFWASGRTVAARDKGGIEAFVKVVRDDSAKRRLQEELHRVNVLLEERVRERTAELQDALNEMGAFSYSIAHDLRAPLRAMTGFADLLEEETAELRGQAREYLHRIRDSAVFMNRMIEDLLSYSRLTRAEVLCHPLDPSLALDRALLQLEEPIRQSRAEILVRRPLPRALGHEVTLTQVFSNLIGNALKFVKPGERPRVRIEGERLDDWVRIWVTDNGIGVPPEHARRIFGIFERLHPLSTYPGTGIGLAIVNRAMERMKGRVGVDPNPDGGSRFWIDLRSVLDGVEAQPKG